MFDTGLTPQCAIIVGTVRALKMHGGGPKVRYSYSGRGGGGGGSRDGAVVRALFLHQFAQVSISGLVVICGLSLLLVLVLASRVSLPLHLFFSLHKNQHFQIPIRPGTHGHL